MPDLPLFEGAQPTAQSEAALGQLALGRPLKEVVGDAVRAVEKQAIADALRRTSGSPAKAARLLGISRASLYNKLKQYGIQP